MYFMGSDSKIAEVEAIKSEAAMSLGKAIGTKASAKAVTANPVTVKAMVPSQCFLVL